MLDKLREEIAGFPGFVWTVILGGLLLRLVIDRAMSFWSGFAACSAGMFCAVLFTKPLIAIADLPKDHTTMMAVAGLWALFGYNFIKVLIGLTDVEGIVRVIKAWREK